MTEQRDATWPEFVYRLVEHYKWEPQHLRGSEKEFDSRIRRQEVPLNYLFNILLCWLSAETITLMLSEFGLSAPGDRFRVQYPWSPSFVQPDVRIESQSVRALIEVKVDAPIELEQVQRYLLLHALMDVLHGPKRSYLLFLSKREFNKCWRPARERSDCTDVQSFLERLTANDVPEELARKLPKLHAKDTLAQYRVVKRGAIYGATTWASLGGCLAKATTSAGDIECGLINDFVKDLSKRELVELKA